MNNLAKAKENFLLNEKNLSEYASKSQDSIRLNKLDEDMRPAYFRDIDRIIHAYSYTRYLDKTQVYSFKNNDHISKRIVHVQLVSKIARTIGRALRLNEDLIEAIALGHDIGHAPLGHSGEAMLNEISKRELNMAFAHNIQGVRYYMNVENGGEGINLTIETLDGIMCHNGEMVSPIYKPVHKTKEEFLTEYENSYLDIKNSKSYHPMTLEGCVVRISDIIAYIGRDIEDAINLGKFKREDLPKEIIDVLGNTNTDIVNTIILDIIGESMDKPYIKMSDKVFDALNKLKEFNYKNIYSKSLSKEEYEYYQTGMNKIFYSYLEDIKSNNKESLIFKVFLNHKKNIYLNHTSPKRMAIDFICGMTDEFFLQEIKKFDK